MCTVIVAVPESAEGVVRMLAVRDEDPQRPWQPLGAWWPEAYPGVVGVRDVRAGGAWLGADPVRGRLAVMLNRPDTLNAAPGELESRGGLVLESVSGRPPRDPRTAGFNLVDVAGATVTVTTWDGDSVGIEELVPGVHMIEHHDVDDPGSARISQWLPEFREAAPAGGGLHDEWWRDWATILERSSHLSPEDDAAIIRDNRAHGYPTLSLLACVASVSTEAADVRFAPLKSPGEWNALTFVPPVQPE
ncbi:NRDE family protein [Paramicrobacterium agarici]|uniref:Transport and Golgi organization protein 2 n=1 Tax=Paramicrobacterium agarici TaxID=630514 RepID=A0A2A9DTS3_9MICO|nr:NRDE family protein [Microbacterium agarici]PFG29320.1 transport and Golgi organization protein 2 [Microbacterium agarici]